MPFSLICHPTLSTLSLPSAARWMTVWQPSRTPSMDPWKVCTIKKPIKFTIGSLFFGSSKIKSSSYVESQISNHDSTHVLSLKCLWLLVLLSLFVVVCCLFVFSRRCWDVHWWNTEGKKVTSTNSIAASELMSAMATSTLETSATREAGGELL